MKKVKVRIYKDPNGQGEYINKTAKFLKKARGGMQVDDLELEEDILNQLTFTQDVDVIASKLQDDYGLDYFEALDQIENIVDGLYKQGVTETKDEILNQDPDIDQPVIVKPKLYSTDEEWISDDNTGWDDFGEETEDAEGTSEDDDLAQEDQEALSLEKKGGAVNKKKFVKTVVTGLRKAAEGMEQDQSSNSSILDTPIGGREAHINLFRRGMKDLGNEFYAKKIYDSTQELQNQVQNLPPSPMGIPKGQEGFQVPGKDPEDLVHHLGAYGNTVGNIFKTNMNQIHGAGFENIPEARRGREQRQADRQQRQVSKDWQNTFGDIAAGYFGVPGMPNYLQVISPQVVSPQANGQGAQGNQGPAGPLVDVQFKKGPWWSGKREWSAKGIPAEMLMGMSGGRDGRMPGYGYMPSNSWSNSSSWSTSRTSPGEIIRTKSRAINAAADPTKNNTVALNNNANTTKAYPGYMELNPAPAGTEMVYDAQGNEVEAISPEEATRRKAAGTSSQYPWMEGSATNPGDIFAKNPPKIGEKNSDYLLRVTGNPGFMRNEDVWNGTAFVKPEEFKGTSAATNLIPQSTATASGASVDRFNLELISSPTKPGTYYGKDATGVLYQFSGDVSEHEVGKEPIGRIAPGSSTYEEVMKSVNLTPNKHEKVKTDDEKDFYVEYGDKDYAYRDGQFYLRPQSYIEDYEQRTQITDPTLIQTLKESSDGANIENAPWKKQYGGSATGATPDEYGNLQRFIYGGGDDVSPIVSYDDNYINSKNVDDPYMFREGGLYKYDGEDNSQVNYTVTNPPAGTPPNQYQTPAFNRYNSNATAQSNFAAFNEMKKRGLVTGNYDPTQSYDMSNTTTTTTNTNTQNQTQNQGSNYPQGYPTAPPLRDQILEKFMPFKKNQQTGKYYDFMWASQRGPATTLDGKPYQPQGQPGATNQPQGQPQGQTTTQGQPGTGQPGQPGVRPAGYVYDYEMKKGPWWGGNKQSLKATARWYDPNNPNSGASANAGQFNNGQGPTIDAGTKGAGTSNFTQSTDGKSAMSYDVKDPGAASSTTPSQPSAFPPGDPRGDYMKSQLTVPTKPSVPEPMPKDFPANNVGPVNTEMAYGGYMDFGGYVPEFNPGGQFSGAGPFDPNDTGIAGGGTGPCTEDQVKNAQPGDPCYNEDYMKSLSPQDFTVDYDLKKARTLDFGNIGNIQMGAMQLGTAAGDMKDAMYNENYLASRTDSGNRQAVNYNDSHGGFDALGNRVGAKTQGRGTKGFNKVVGDAAFTRDGGELKYQKGGVYDLTQEEIGKILAAGGQIKFIK